MRRVSFVRRIVPALMAGRLTVSACEPRRERLAAAVSSPIRSEAFRSRDGVRNPERSLAVLGGHDRMAVVEIDPAL